MKKKFLFFGAILAALSIFSLISCKTESDDDGYKGFTEVNTGFSGTYLYAGLKNGMVSGGESFAAVNVYDFKTNGRVDYGRIKETNINNSMKTDTENLFELYTKKDSTLTWKENGETITATIENENTIKIGDKSYKKTKASSIYAYAFIINKTVKYSVYVLNADNRYSLETKIEEMNSSGTGIDTKGSVEENGTYSISGENITFTSSNGTTKQGKTCTEDSREYLDLGDKVTLAETVSIDIKYRKLK